MVYGCLIYTHFWILFVSNKMAGLFHNVDLHVVNQVALADNHKFVVLGYAVGDVFIFLVETLAHFPWHAFGAAVVVDEHVAVV